MIRGASASELRIPLQPASSGLDLSSLSTASQTELQFAAQHSGRGAAGTGAGGSGLDTPEFREKFQEFVAGTFYKTMFKALRQGQGKVPYLHGGMAEEMFQQHLDTQLAQELSGPHGGMFTEQLYQNYRQSFGLPAESVSDRAVGKSAASASVAAQGSSDQAASVSAGQAGVMSSNPWSDEGVQNEFSVAV